VKLRQHGAQADAQEISEVHNLEGYDAFVIGSAVYMTHWLKEAAEFVMRNRAVLASHPVWLFSSGPLGTETKDAQGRDVLVAAEPKEIAEFKVAINPVTIKSSSEGWTLANSRSVIGWSERCPLPVRFFPRVTSATGTTSMLGPSASAVPFLHFFPQRLRIRL
jgi:Flavodoxin domain